MMTQAILAAISAWQLGDMRRSYEILRACADADPSRFLNEYLDMRPPTAMGAEFFTVRKVGDKLVCALREPRADVAS